MDQRFRIQDPVDLLKKQTKVETLMLESCLPTLPIESLLFMCVVVIVLSKIILELGFVLCMGMNLNSLLHCLH